MKLTKCILLSLILITILFFSALSVSAADVHDNFDNISLDTNDNDLTNLQDNIVDLNSDDYQTENLKNNSEVLQNSNLGNDLNVEKIDLKNLTELYNITQTSEKTFILSLPNNITLNICRLGVYDLQSFKDASAFISKPDENYDLIMLEFKDKLNLEIEPWVDELINLKSIKNLMIYGHGATISIRNPRIDNIKHFLKVNSGTMATINNITLTGFNSAILNYGQCQMTKVDFNKNIVDFRYEIKYANPILKIPDFSDVINHKDEVDYGGAIRNFGTLNCMNCSFTNNIAKLGGAIYNEKGTQSSFINCFFKGNEIYTVVVYDTVTKTKYVYDNEERYPREMRLFECEGFDCNNEYDIHTCDLANCFVYNENDEIYIAYVNNTADLNKFFSNIKSIKYMKFCILNFQPNTTYNIDSDFEGMNYKNIENLIINGNGAILNVKDPKNNNECHFLQLHRKASCLVKNLTFIGFNQAFINQGTLNIVNSTFKVNKCYYMIKDDYGSSIYNNEGLVYLSNTRFEDGYAKNGGAVYNNRGIVICTGCDFTENVVYGDGGAIYNAFGITSCENCIFTSNKADDGGAIFNHYGTLRIINTIFGYCSVTGDGGSIYNDFGELTISNNTFINSQAVKGNGKDIFSYGAEAKVSVIGESYSITEIGEKVTNQTIKITEDAPNEIARYAVRAVEIVLCVGLCCALTFLGVPEGSAAVIGFVVGSLLAGAEELYEECCLDHNFNIYNCLAMVVVAGLSDSICGAVGTWIGTTFFKVGTQELTAKVAGKLGAICFGLEVTGEILTEFLPRFDFSNMDMVTVPINDLINQQVQKN
ncbi:hypothetical protein TL18_03825 [Methanobrevibacter sp. YE315]|uniref:hypothetical protein n=1 Tax=Methanobrevibacter sp. YE315 TaxID=1609968 RepID=UPI000764E164|nr:hypothetical protein [Methanobrevibacter sp. YE315]AMD17226.1 hypothetical protein TL18_03825 [Methanobrevibacter sp. YE315]